MSQLTSDQTVQGTSRKKSGLTVAQFAAIPLPEDISAGEDWGASLTSLAAEIGPKSALALAERFGGRTLALDTAAGRGAIQDAIGDDKLKSLVLLRGRSVRVPVADKEIIVAKKAALRQLVISEKMSEPEAAQVLGVSIEQLNRRLKLRTFGPSLDHLPRLEDFPIPFNTPIGGKGWSASMLEIATHIGGRATLMLCEKFGGRVIVVPETAALSPFSRVIGAARTELLCSVYRREKLQLCTGKAAIAISKRASVLACVRAGQLSGNHATIILGTARRYLSKLLSSDEGRDTEPCELPVPRERRLLTDAAAVCEEILIAVGADPEVVERARSDIMDLAF